MRLPHYFIRHDIDISLLVFGMILRTVQVDLLRCMYSICTYVKFWYECVRKSLIRYGTRNERMTRAGTVYNLYNIIRGFSLVKNDHKTDKGWFVFRDKLTVNTYFV